MSQGLKLSEIKANIKNVIENLQLLETSSNLPVSEFNLEASLQLQKETTDLITHLAEAPLEKIANKQQQRKRIRQKAKNRAREQKLLQKAAPKHTQESSIVLTETSANRAPLPVSSQALRKHQDSTRMLQSLDLLERLYKARGGQDDLKGKLDRMRNVWQRVQQESANVIHQAKPASYAEQWAKVTFGTTSIPPEQRITKEHKFTKEFVRRRFIWDSYISTGKLGSSVPHGWVLPSERPTAEWAKYKCE